MTKEEMEGLKALKAAIKGLEKHTDVKGVQYVGIRGYRNEYGEIADVLINVGIPHSKILQDDLALYLNGKEDIAINAHLVQKYGITLTNKAFEEKIKSCTTCLDGTNVRSKAQHDAYLPITSGMKYCIATETVFLRGLFVNKTILVPGEYPTRNKRQLTLCKEELDKLVGARSKDTRIYKLKAGNIGIVKIAGDTLEFPIQQAA